MTAWRACAAAYSRHARMSSASRNGLSARISASFAPAASNARTSATRIRMPRTVGRPCMTSGFMVIRASRDMNFSLSGGVTPEKGFDQTAGVRLHSADPGRGVTVGRGSRPKMSQVVPSRPEPSRMQPAQVPTSRSGPKSCVSRDIPTGVWYPRVVSMSHICNWISSLLTATVRFAGTS